MSTPTLSLQDLVHHAAMQLRCQWVELHGLDDAPDGGDEGRAYFEGMLAEVLYAVDQGDFSQTRRTAFDPYAWKQGPVIPSLEGFQHACELAERIDCLLSLPLTGFGEALARSCRDDLDTLAALADWLLENGRPNAAAEARHLLGLVRMQPRNPPLLSLGKPPGWWERGIEPPEYYSPEME
jgi:hypothetical protein